MIRDDIAAERLQLLREFEAATPRSQQKTIGWSSVGDECSRLVWNFLHDVPQVNDKQQVLATLRGHAIHAYLEPAFLAAGWKVETDVEFAGIRGHVDLFRDGVVEDIKTGSGDKVRALRTYGPSRSWRYQLHGYAAGLVAQGEDVRTVRITAYAADASEEVAVWEEPFSQAVADEAVARVEALAEQVEPPAPGRDADWCRRFCSFFDETMDRGGCPSRTLGSRLVELEDPVLRQAAVALRQAREGIKAETERKKAAEAVLDGASGLVDGYAVTQVTVAPSEVPDDEAIREAYGFVIGELPTRSKAGYSYVSIRKARRAEAS